MCVHCSFHEMMFMVVENQISKSILPIGPYKEPDHTTTHFVYAFAVISANTVQCIWFGKVYNIENKVHFNGDTSAMFRWINLNLGNY